MYTNIYLFFQGGKCREAFSFYERVFQSKVAFSMTYAEVPDGTPAPEGMGDQICHIAMPLGAVTLMGADDYMGTARPMGGFNISVDVAEDEEVHRLYDALAESGAAGLPLGPTFWSPLFGMVTDRYGVGWMISKTAPASVATDR